MSSLRVFTVALLSTLLAIAPLFAVDSYHVTDFVNSVMDDASETVLVSNNSGSCTDGVGCTATCDQCAVCDTCCCNECVPPWRVQVGYINMSRSRPSESPTFFRRNNNSPQLNLNELDLGTQSGVDVNLRRTLNQDWDLDARYLWISDYSDNAIVTLPTSLLPDFAGGGIAALYRSTFQSAELNMRRNYGCWGLSGGFRYVELNDNYLNLGVINPFPLLPNGSITEGGTATRNNLYGFQLGADAILWQNCHGFRIDSYVKAGIYGNDSSAASFEALTTGQGNPTVSTASGEAYHTSFLGELGFMGVYCLTEHLSLRAGYQMMWLSGLALPVEQQDAQVNGSVISPDNSGDVFYHGVNVGLEIAW